MKTSFLILAIVLFAGCAAPAASVDSVAVAAADAAPAASPAETAAVAATTAVAATAAPAAGTTAKFTIPGTDVSYTMVYVPGGEAMVGTPLTAPREANEPEPTAVELSPFWMGKHEVTFDEYAVFRLPRLDADTTATGLPYDVDAVVRPSPPYEDPSAGMSQAGYPATGMTQWGALQYARWISEKTGVFHRLPTEAEWEYVCRLGGDRDIDSAAWYWDNSGERFQPVGTKAADALGLHDILGNVSEWTLDEYREDYAAVLAEQPTDPWVRPTALHPRTVRGGAFDDPVELQRCGARTESTLNWKRRDPQIPKSFWWNTDSPFLGFRLVQPVRQPTPEEAAEFWALVLGD